MNADNPQLNMVIISQLREIESMMPGTFSKLISEFATDGDQRITAIEAAGAADLARVAAEAHSLKGAGGSIGAAEVARVAAVIERDAKAGKWAAEQVPELRAAFKGVIPQLRAIVGA